MYPFGTFLSKLGSRFSLFLDAPNRRVRHSALGRYFDTTADLDLAIGVKAGDTAYSVPLTKRYEPFTFCEQHLTMTGVRYVGNVPELGLRFIAELRSPFYPRDEKLSLAPMFYITLSVEPITWFHWTFPRKDLPQTGTLMLELKRKKATRDTSKRTRGVWFEYRTHNIARRVFGEGPNEKAIPKGHVPFDAREAVVPLDRQTEVRGWRLHRKFSLPLERPVTMKALWAAYVDKPKVLTIEEKTAAFKYTKHFTSLEKVVAYGRKEREAILDRCDFFDGLFAESSLTKSHKDLVAFSFQNYLSNTWWMDAEGRDWFSVWEGVCRYHSTVDVEYNLGMVYFALWPELLEKEFAEWTNYEKESAEGAGWMSHDVGGDLWVGRQIYDHEMEIEENTNFILMLHALWRWTGNDRLVKKYGDQVHRLSRFILDADTTGNGIPNQGTWNTIDDASPAVQYAKEQTYLAVKALAALEMAAEIADERAEDDLAKEYRKRVGTIRKTLDSQAWLGDHFATCLERTTEGLLDWWTKEPLPAGELEGWNAYSIYTANGMLYPALVGRSIAMDADRLRTDVLAATREANTPFGCTHSSVDRSNIWVSQNLWRDYCAAYLGEDLLDMADRYWAFELWENHGPHAPGFVDTYGGNNLCYYPRGITSMGVLFAALGLSLDRKEGVLRLKPVRAPARLPLVALADWKKMKVPWANVTIEEGKVDVAIEGDLPKGLKVEIG